MKSQPFVGPIAGLILGILIAENSLVVLSFQLQWLIFFVLIAALFFWKKHYHILWVVFVFSVLGFFRFEQYNHVQKIPDQFYQKKTEMRLKIMDTYRSTEHFHKYKVQLLSSNGQSFEKAYSLLYLSKNNAKLYSGEVIEVRAQLKRNEAAKNPYQFDYSKFLSRKKIHSTIYAYEISDQKESYKSIAYFTSKFKDEIHQSLLQQGYSKQSCDQISAMLLGDRTEMDKNIEEQYRKTGVVHILAISGLHVAMVYSIFYVLLVPLRYFKHGKSFQILLSIVLIWSFVVFVGFHPPVLRAALMISIVHLALVFRRKSNIYHSLLFSACILLLLNPNFLFEVGFQLSYAAVFFIVYLLPVFQKIFQPKRTWSKWVVGFVSTCTAAQLGTLPFSMYYFHQTSGLFLAGNIVMVFAAYVMIALGMLAVILTVLNILIPLLVLLFNGFIWICNTYIERLSSWDSLVFERIHLTWFESILLLIGLLLLRLLVFRPNFRWIFISLLLFVGFEGQRVVRQYRLLQKQEVVLFHHEKSAVIGIRQGKKMDVYIADLDHKENIQRFVINGFVVHQKIKKVHYYNDRQLRNTDCENE